MNIYLRALRYFREDLGKIGVSLVLIGVMVVVGLLAPVPIAIFFNVMNADDSADGLVYRIFDWVPREKSAEMVLYLAAAMFVLRIGNEIVRTIQAQLNILIGYRGRTRVQLALFQKLQQLSLSYHKAQPQGDAIYRLSYDTHGFHGVLGVATGALVNVLTLVVMLGFMLDLDWKLTLISLAIVPALFLVISKWGNVLKKYNIAQKEADANLTTQIQRSLSAVGLVQAFNRQLDEHERFGATVRSYIDASLRLHWQEILYWLVLGVIIAVGSVAMFAFGGIQAVRGTISVGTLWLFINYLGQLYDPLSKLSGSTAGLQSAGVGVERVFEVLDRDPIINDRPDAVALSTQPRTLRFEQVDFRYANGELVLRDVSFSVEPGQMVAFVGSSGVGKTTLLNLLPRFHDPVGGRVLLDEHDMRSVKVSDVRRHVALVLQENPILPTSVAENIAYGRPDASDADIRRAAELAGAATFIDAMPNGYATTISEQGSNLSGGQRQRIAIARALLTQAPIVVLDEPTSALDAMHEQRINNTLLGLKRRRTIIVVSHRLSTVLDADMIYVMDGGRIVEQGTHTQLLDNRSVYWQMAKHQLRLEEEGG